MDSYYNTTNIMGDDLKNEIQNAVTQEDKVLAFFKGNPENIYTPDEVLGAIFSIRVPITSVRRAITTLTNKGLLIKTRYQRRSAFGKVTYCWQVKL